MYCDLCKQVITFMNRGNKEGRIKASIDEKLDQILAKLSLNPNKLTVDIAIFTKAIELSRRGNQILPDSRDYYITLRQLEYLIKSSS